MTDHPYTYAVADLPPLQEAHTSSDDRPRSLLRNVRHLLDDVANMPIMNANSEEFKTRLAVLKRANETAARANHQHNLAVMNFIEWATSPDRRMIGKYLDDIVLEYY